MTRRYGRTTGTHKTNNTTYGVHALVYTSTSPGSVASAQKTTGQPLAVGGSSCCQSEKFVVSHRLVMNAHNNERQQTWPQAGGTMRANFAAAPTTCLRRQKKCATVLVACHHSVADSPNTPGRRPRNVTANENDVSARQSEGETEEEGKLPQTSMRAFINRVAPPAPRNDEQRTSRSYAVGWVA